MKAPSKISRVKARPTTLDSDLEEHDLVEVAQVSTLGTVYGIVNKHNGKAYIGSTTRDVRRRWSEHLWKLRQNKANSYLQNAWDKYGSDAFQFHILEADIPVDCLTNREQYWLDNWPVDVYNVGEVADPPNRGRIFSDETRKRIAEGHKQFWATKTDAERSNNTEAARRAAANPEVRKRAADSLRGFRHSEATKRQMSESAKGRRASDETRARMSKATRGENNPRYGVIMAQETKDKIARSNAKPYPAFVNLETGEVIPTGFNLCKLCRDRGLTQPAMHKVIKGLQKKHKGWALAYPMEV